MRKRLPLPTIGNHVNISMASIEKMCAANAALHKGCLRQIVRDKHVDLTERRAAGVVPRKQNRDSSTDIVETAVCDEKGTSPV